MALGVGIKAIGLINAFENSLKQKFLIAVGSVKLVLFIQIKQCEIQFSKHIKSKENLKVIAFECAVKVLQFLRISILAQSKWIFDKAIVVKTVERAAV